MQISTLKPSSYSNVFDTCVVEDLKPLNGRQEDQQACSGFGLVRWPIANLRTLDAGAQTPESVHPVMFCIPSYVVGQMFDIVHCKGGIHNRCWLYLLFSHPEIIEDSYYIININLKMYTVHTWRGDALVSVRWYLLQPSLSAPPQGWCRVSG